MLRLSEVSEWLGCSKSQVYNLSRTEGFPRPLRIGPRTSRWRVRDVLEWLESRQPAQGEPNTEAE